MQHSLTFLNETILAMGRGEEVLICGNYKSITPPILDYQYTHNEKLRLPQDIILAGVNILENVGKHRP